MEIITGMVESVEYFDTSRNGNSRHVATINGVRVFTGVDSSLGCAIKNYEGRRVSVEVRTIRGKLTIDGTPQIVPEHPNAAYYREQIGRIQWTDEHRPSIQIFGKGGPTNHMNISAAQLRAILDIMLTGEEV